MILYVNVIIIFFLFSNNGDNTIVLPMGKIFTEKISCSSSQIHVADDRILSAELSSNYLIVSPRSVGSTAIYVTCQDGSTLVKNITVTTFEGIISYHTLKKFLVDELRHEYNGKSNGLEILFPGDRLIITGNMEDVQEFLKLRQIIKTIDFPISNFIILQPERLRVLADVISNELMDAGIRVSVKAMGNVIFLEGVVPDIQTKRKMLSIVEAYTRNYVDLVEVGIGKDFIVSLELYLIEVGERDIKELGVNWPLIIDSPISLQLGLSRGGSSSVSTSESLNGDVSRSQDSSSEQRGNVSFGLSGSAQFVAGLRLLLQSGRSRVLSSPKLVVKNGGKARFVVGGKIPIPSITTTAGVQTTAIDFRDFGIVLVVQPTVDMQRNVSMVVAAELSEPSKDLAVQNVPGFISRYVETSVLLKDRNTLMLSGLTSQSDSKGVRKVPILGSIPILGELFKSRSMETQSKDLVIFITPYVYSVDEIEKLEKKEIDRMKEKYEEYMNTKEIKISD